jgi:hypothetical protein
LYGDIDVIDIDRTYMHITITQKKKESISVSLEDRLSLH